MSFAQCAIFLTEIQFKEMDLVELWFVVATFLGLLTKAPLWKSSSKTHGGEGAYPHIGHKRTYLYRELLL